MWTQIGNVGGVFDWLSVDQGTEPTDIGRTVGLMVRDGVLTLRVIGRISDGRRMTKFFNMDREQPLDFQIVAALEVWNRDAGF